MRGSPGRQQREKGPFWFANLGGGRSHTRRSVAATDTGSPVYDRRSARAVRTVFICVGGVSE